MSAGSKGETLEAAAPRTVEQVQKVAEADIVVVRGRVVKSRAGRCSDVSLTIKDGVVEVTDV